MGKIYRENGKPEKAYEVLTRGFIQDPKSTYLLAALETLLTETNNANDEEREKLNLSGQPVDIPLKIALFLFGAREYEKCSTYLEKALKLDPNHAESLRTKDKLMETIEKNTKFIHISDICNNQDFKENRLFRLYMALSNFILTNYSRLKFMVGYLVEAAGKIRPDNPFVHVYLARRHLEMGRLDKAVKIIDSVP